MSTNFRDATLVDAGLLRVLFVNLNSGWVVGRRGIILHTEDGGKHWEHQKSGSSKFNLANIQCTNTKIGWIIGEKVSNGWTGVILHTEDGGKHWLRQYSIKDVGLSGIFFLDKNSGWVTGLSEDGGSAWLLRTDDGGKKWMKEEFGDIGYSDPAFLDKERGVISTHKDWLIITTDGGKTWKKTRKPIRGKYPWHFSELFRVEQKSK